MEKKCSQLNIRTAATEMRSNVGLGAVIDKSCCGDNSQVRILPSRKPKIRMIYGTNHNTELSIQFVESTWSPTPIYLHLVHHNIKYSNWGVPMITYTIPFAQMFYQLWCFADFTIFTKRGTQLSNNYYQAKDWSKYIPKIDLTFVLPW